MEERYIIGNWKMGPTTHKEALRLVSGVVHKNKNTTIVLTPPSLFIPSVVHATKKFKEICVGSQGVSQFDHTTNAHTNHISAKMLANAGVSFCIIGHSENRALGETSAIVVEKIKQAVKERIRPIVCVGEAKKSNMSLQTLKKQLSFIIQSLPTATCKKIIIAYEPVWAIGGGKETPTLGELEKRITIIKQYISAYKQVPILYGGSVNAKNIADIMKADIQGVLVGSSSLDSVSFNNIIKQVQ